ncbi:MAG: serine/threonine-protein kinase [Planctomycetota bacterium]
MSYEFETIGPYRVVGILGQGGMGTVYRGVHAKSREEVAIKVISVAIAQHARFRRRFDAEIQTLLRLKHPNIVQLIGFGEEKGLLFYSMEYVDGDNLHQKLCREKRFPWQTVLDWAIEIAGALKHAHDLGVIHRDLKPANLMVNREGHIKLTDFGIAKLFGANEQTVPGSVLGTADFMSPEQAEGKPVGLRSDLYALGAIGYTLLAGRAPFSGSSVPEVLFNVRYGNLKPLRELSPDSPIEFCELIEELMSRDPAQRPPTTIVVSKRLQSLKVGLSKIGSSLSSPAAKPNATNLELDSTSLPLSDHPSIAGLSHDPNQTRMLQSSLQTPSEQESPEPARLPSAAPLVAGPHEDTALAGEVSGSSLRDIPSGIGQQKNTNFTEVTDTDRQRSTWVIHEEPKRDAWSQWLGTGGLVALLIGCIAAVYWFSLPPRPDALYRPISDAMRSEDRSRFEAIEETARRFVELYPEDARVPEVAEQLEDLQHERTIRQLQSRSRTRSEIGLDALEQAFVDCSRSVEVDREGARRKLAALLTVFPLTDETSAKHRKLIAAAQRMLEDLESSASDGYRSIAQESLQAQMQWAETHLSREDRTAWLRSMIELYQEKPWAAELVKSARRMVDTGP